MVSMRELCSHLFTGRNVTRLLDRRSFAGAAVSSAFLGWVRPADADETMITVPPEEAPHARTFMMWPTSRQIYDDQVFLDITQQTIADIANVISAFEPVTLLAAGDLHAAIQKRGSQQVELWDVPTEDLWCRDAGPAWSDAGRC